jgi:hypothetical protein
MKALHFFQNVGNQLTSGASHPRRKVLNHTTTKTSRLGQVYFVSPVIIYPQKNSFTNKAFLFYTMNNKPEITITAYRHLPVKAMLLMG